MIISRNAAFRHDVDADAVIRLVFAAQDAGLRSQLPAHLRGRLRRGLPDSVHAERGENVGKQPADEQPDDRPLDQFSEKSKVYAATLVQKCAAQFLRRTSRRAPAASNPADAIA
jgi:hypothetical protein